MSATIVTHGARMEASCIATIPITLAAAGRGTRFADRVIRAPRGTQRTAKSWLTEAPLRMLMNNLDPEVAENPKELVVYGGIGRAARNWECFDAIVAALRELGRRRVAADPVGQAGRRVQDARRRAARADRQLEPRAEVGDVGALQRARPQGPHDVRPDDGRLVDLHRQPGHRAGHVRDVRRSGAPALRRRARRQVDPDRGPGRHGRRAAARGDDGRRVDARDRVPAVAHRDAARDALSRPRRRATSTTRSRSSRDACAARKPVSVGLLGNAAEILPELVRRGVRPAHGHRPDVRARSRLRLPAGRLDASSAGAPRRPIRRSTRRSSPRRSNRSTRTSRRCSRSTRRASRRSTTATTSGRSRSTKAWPTRSPSRASCPRTSGRCSARARGRSAGSRCPAIRRTSARPTAR